VVECVVAAMARLRQVCLPIAGQRLDTRLRSVIPITGQFHYRKNAPTMLSGNRHSWGEGNAAGVLIHELAALLCVG
jgi:hypothetical protein